MLKKVTLFAAVCGICGAIHAQKTFSIGASYVGDSYYNATGGHKTGGGYLGMANLTLGFDTEKARWWRGGTFFVNGASIHGKSLTENYLGDLQVA
jgi:porin